MGVRLERVRSQRLSNAILQRIETFSSLFVHGRLHVEVYPKSALSAQQPCPDLLDRTLLLPAPMSRHFLGDLIDDHQIARSYEDAYCAGILGECGSEASPLEECGVRTEIQMPCTAETVLCATALRWHEVHQLLVDEEDPRPADPPSASNASHETEPEPAPHASLESPAASQALAIPFAEEYMLQHCQIKAADLKPNALVRLRDLGRLFAELETKGTIRLARSHESLNSVFGFSRIFVDEVCSFNAEVIRMVDIDKSGCWKANGRRTLQHPTSPVYEMLRQCGIHPVKGTRWSSSKTHPQKCKGKGITKGAPSLNNAAPIGERNFMIFEEYVFDAQRMKSNCSRLKIGVIGNRRV